MKKSQKSSLTRRNKSVIFKLTNEGYLDNTVLVNINNITLEDLIAIKLELSAKHLNNRPYGFDMWRKSRYIIKEAFLKFAISTTNSKKAAARFLGINYIEFKKALKDFKIESYFEEDVEIL